jgi:hypothetical protein
MEHAKELILVDPTDSQNLFIWERVRLNMPGALGYDPTMSWVSKVREDWRVAAYLYIYMDEMRPTAPSEEECWQTGLKTGSL